MTKILRLHKKGHKKPFTNKYKCHIIKEKTKKNQIKQNLRRETRCKNQTLKSEKKVVKSEEESMLTDSLLQTTVTFQSRLMMILISQHLQVYQRVI